MRKDILHWRKNVWQLSGPSKPFAITSLGGNSHWSRTMRLCSGCREIKKPTVGWQGGFSAYKPLTSMFTGQAGTMGMQMPSHDEMSCGPFLALRKPRASGGGNVMSWEGGWSWEGTSQPHGWCKDYEPSWLPGQWTTIPSQQGGRARGCCPAERDKSWLPWEERTQQLTSNTGARGRRLERFMFCFWN